MNTLRKAIYLLINPVTLSLIAAVSLFSIANSGNSFIIADLRYDLPEVYSANNYRVFLYPAEQPQSGDYRNFTTAWFGIFLAEGDGSPYSSEFAQVGIRATRDGVQWFVYAEPGVNCYRGSSPDSRHCYGDYGDLVSLGNWHQIRLFQASPGSNWYARVYDQSGGYYTVARIESQSDRIYLARSDTEEGYYETVDPFIAMKFYHWHPQYEQGGNWIDWPESDSIGTNVLFPYPATICPDEYGATTNLSSDDRYWFAGTGGQECKRIIFPASRIYVPIIIAN